MPWSVEGEHPQCPASRPWAVVNDESGEVEGCHATQQGAQQQQAALYAQEETNMSADDEFTVARHAPRDDLIRGITEVRTDGDGNTMVGYPIVFDTWTEIDSWEGRFRERVHPGAVNKTLRERGDQVKVQFDHGMHPVIGSLPLGRAETMRTDDLGLWVEVPLSHARDVQELIKPRLAEGSIDGMSFRFSVVSQSWDKEDTDLPERTIHELRLFEFGPVTWPAYEATQVGIRGQAGFAAWMSQSPEERAQLMRDAGVAPQREIIRIRSGAVEVDTPEHKTRDDVVPVAGTEETEAAETATELPADEPARGHSSGDSEPAEGHSHTESDAPAEGHSSSDQEPTAVINVRAEKPPMDREHMRRVAASIKRQTRELVGAGPDEED